MTLILKSNVPATKSIGNIYGVNKNPNFSMLLDFGMERYLQKSPNATKQLSFKDALTFTRYSPAIGKDNLGRFVRYEKDIPRFDVDTATQDRGLLMEGKRVIVFNEKNPVSKTITIPDSTFLALIHVEGSGSVKLANAVGSAMTPQKGGGDTAYEGKPVVYALPDRVNTTVDMVITGSVSRVTISRLDTIAGYNIKYQPPAGVALVTEDSCEVKQELVTTAFGSFTDYTIVFKWTENEFYTTTPQEISSTTKNLFSFIGDSTSGVTGIYASRTIGKEPRLQVTFMKNGVRVKSYLVVLDSSVRRNTVVLSVAGSGSKTVMAYNGIVQNSNEDVTVTVSRLLLASPNNYNSFPGLNGIVRQVVAYPFAVNWDEAKEISLE